MSEFKDFLKEQLQDDEFRKEWELILSLYCSKIVLIVSSFRMNAYRGI